MQYEYVLLVYHVYEKIGEFCYMYPVTRIYTLNPYCSKIILIFQKFIITNDFQSIKTHFKATSNQKSHVKTLINL